MSSYQISVQHPVGRPCCVTPVVGSWAPQQPGSLLLHSRCQWVREKLGMHDLTRCWCWWSQGTPSISQHPWWMCHSLSNRWVLALVCGCFLFELEWDLWARCLIQCFSMLGTSIAGGGQFLIVHSKVQRIRNFTRVTIWNPKRVKWIDLDVQRWDPDRLICRSGSSILILNRGHDLILNGSV